VPTIKVQQWPSPVRSTRGSILDAALAAGVPYPHDCRSGECGSCKSRLISGDVMMDGCAPEALTAEERATGLILACRSRPRGDVEVEWLQGASVTDISHPVRRVDTHVVHVERATHDITRLQLAVRGAPLAFSAGQYAQLSFGDCPARSYSMANRPDDPTLEFHIRHMPEGITSTYVAKKLQPGERVRLEGPFGTAFLREPITRPLVLVAGGSGLAPMKSILLAALDRQCGRPIHLYHGVREERDLYDAEFIEELSSRHGFAYVPVLSADAGNSRCRTGFVHEVVSHDFQTLAGYDVYMAGPPPMVDAATAVAVELGVDRENVRADAFFSAPSASAAKNPFRAVANLLRNRKVA
jgi:CDP-4-dehydro-6-deoxyglucose reductase/ferredoxin-NAD(P)+ reductase (naphthalene dioxygenase ferredoxin-specific)